MRTYRQILAAFCSVLSLLGQTVFAYQGSEVRPQTQKLGQTVGIVRMENGKAVCVKAVQGYGFIQKELPTCTDTQDEIALNLAQSSGPTRTAWVTHAAFAGVGCLMGALSAMGGMSFESGIRDDHRGTFVGAITGPAVVGTVGAVSMYAVSEPTGHILAGAAGMIVCAGAFNYLLYREIASKK